MVRNARPTIALRHFYLVQPRFVLYLSPGDSLSAFGGVGSGEHDVEGWVEDSGATGLADGFDELRDFLLGPL